MTARYPCEDCEQRTGKPCIKRRCAEAWTAECVTCGCKIEVNWGRLDVLGPYCSGCFGYPACSCDVSHIGECKP